MMSWHLLLVRIWQPVVLVKSYVDIEAQLDTLYDTENVVDNEKDVVVDKGKNSIESSTIVSTISNFHKRSRASPTDDSVYNDLSDQLKEIVVAQKTINQGPINFTHLYAKVTAMSVEGYSDDMLATMFDDLCERKKADGIFGEEF